MDWFNYSVDVPLMDWYGPVLGRRVLRGGWPFLAGGAVGGPRRQPGMMLITMAISVAYVARWRRVSIGLTLRWSSALVTIMLLGHWQEMKAIGQAQNALAALAALLPDEADLVEGDMIRQVRASELRVGDVVLVRPGARVPADGTIVEGSAEVDESMITGESKPISRTVGGRVVAGTVSTDSSVRVRGVAVGDDTALAGSAGPSPRPASQSRAQYRRSARRPAVLCRCRRRDRHVRRLAGDRRPSLRSPAPSRARDRSPHALGLAIPLVSIHRSRWRA